PGFADYFTHTALPAVFSSTLLPHDVAGLSAALKVVREEGRRRDRLAAVTRRLRDGLAALGYRLVESDTQIIALETGSEADATFMRDALVDRDIFSAALFPPTASVGRTLVRLSAHAGLTYKDVNRVLGACEALLPRLAGPAPAPATAGWPGPRDRRRFRRPRRGLVRRPRRRVTLRAGTARGGCGRRCNAASCAAPSG